MVSSCCSTLLLRSAGYRGFYIIVLLTFGMGILTAISKEKPTRIGNVRKKLVHEKKQSNNLFYGVNLVLRNAMVTAAIQ